MAPADVVIVGAGVGGLAAALTLAAAGRDVLVCERASAPGGKLRRVACGGRELDVGPTVFTMRGVFEELFADAGETFADHVDLQPLAVLARHGWQDGGRLDLFADLDASAAAIAAFAGSAEAARFRRFCADARRMFAILEKPFLRAPAPSLAALISAVHRLDDLLAIRPFTTMWRALGSYFHDARLRQLFGRYATYCGSSPFAAPATLMLIAHVEQAGVWTVAGGMHGIATALAGVAQAKGARLRYGTQVEEILVANGRVAGVALAGGERVAAATVVVNADAAAIAAGCFGSAVAGAVAAAAPACRSLSAITWAMTAPTQGFPLLRHNVFFSDDYAAEFAALAAGRMPTTPTVYVHAEDRGDHDGAAPDAERLFCLINAPPVGDAGSIDSSEVASCADRTFALLDRCGLTVSRRPDATVTTTPVEFAGMFPATGGALYGMASHGWSASFRRPGVRTRIPGLYLAGGSVHPGPGLPMAALSGRVAAACLLADSASTAPSRRMAMRGGMSTR